MTLADLARTVRSRRHDLGLTQAELSELAGVSPRFLHDLERGKPTVRLEAVDAVCTALGLELVARRRNPRRTDE